MARFLEGVSLPPPASGLGSGPLLTLHEFAALAKAPQRRPADGAAEPVYVPCPPGIGDPGSGRGTAVTVRGRPVWNTGGLADHEFVEFDDGRHHYIARGEPDSSGMADYARKDLGGTLHVRAHVDPAEQSADYGQDARTLFRGFLPEVSADQAKSGAEQHAAAITRAGHIYGLTHNSNSYAADVTEGLFGCRVGDDRTVGFRNRLIGAPPF